MKKHEVLAWLFVVGIACISLLFGQFYQTKNDTVKIQQDTTEIDKLRKELNDFREEINKWRKANTSWGNEIADVVNEHENRIRRLERR